MKKEHLSLWMKALKWYTEKKEGLSVSNMILADRETGVNYLYVTEAGGYAGLTVLLDAEG